VEEPSTNTHVLHTGQIHAYIIYFRQKWLAAAGSKINKSSTGVKAIAAAAN